MNKLLILIIGLFLFTACGKNEEERLNEMVAETIKSNLLIPESYDPVSLQCDSMLRNVFSASNISKAAKIVKLMNEAKTLQKSIDWNEEQTEYWRGRYGELYSDYSKKAQKEISQRNEIIAKAKSLFGDLYSQYSGPKEFCGYIIVHKYRAKSNAGIVSFGAAIILLDKNKKNITAVFDAENEDFLIFLQLTQAMQELGENLDLDKVNLVEICNNIKSKFELMTQ